MKVKRSTIKFKQKRGKEKLKKKIFGGTKKPSSFSSGAFGGGGKRGGGHHGGGKGGYGQRRGGSKPEREEQKVEEKGKKLGVDEFLDQDFGDLSESDSLENLSDLSDSESLSPLEDESMERPEMEGESASSDSEGEGDEQRPSRGKKVVLIDKHSIRKWCTAALESSSLKAVQNLVKAYRVGCHYGDDEEETSEISFRLSDSSVFNELMLFVLKNLDTIFRRILKVQSGQSVEKALQSSKWKKVGPLVKSYLGNSLHLVSNVTESTLSAFIFQRLRASIDLYTQFPILCKKLLKVSLKFFGTGLGNVEADRTLRIQSILVVRSLALTPNQSLLDDCYKGVYRTFQSCAKFVNQANIGSIHFMQECIVEILGVHPDALYKHVFIFIREAALLVRNALTAKSKDAYQKVYSWQTICSLNLLEMLVSRYGSDSKAVLQPLIYPLVQVLTLTATLVPSSRYLPLRFHVLKAMLKLSKNTGTFIPVSPIILDALNFSELVKKPSGPGSYSNLAGLLKVPKPTLKTIAFQEQCVAQVILLLAEHCNQWSNHIAFPELFLPLGVQVKSLLKSELLVKKFKLKLSQLLDAGHKSTERILVKRQSVTFSPRNIEDVSGFMKDLSEEGRSPMGKFLEGIQKQIRSREENNSVSTVWLQDDAQNKRSGGKTPLDEDEVLDYGKEIVLDKASSKSSDPVQPEEGSKQEPEVRKNEDRVEDFEMSSDDEDSDEEESAEIMGGDSDSDSVSMRGDD